MNVYLFTTKILISSTIGMPVQVAFYVEIYDKIPNDFEEKKKCNRFVSKRGLGVSNHQ